MPVHDWTKVDAGAFHDFHTAWLVEIRNALNGGLLPNGFYALAEQSARSIGPDVLTLERRESQGAEHGEHGHGKALAVAAPRVKWVFHGEAGFYLRKQRRLVIRHRSDDRLVAVIEIASQSNKASRAAVRTFADWAVAILQAGIHLVVIDLYPPTKRDPRGLHGAIWEELGEKQYKPPPAKRLTLASYEAGEGVTAYVNPLAVGDRLTEMPLFLVVEEYVDLPLETTYRAAWKGVPRHLKAILEDS